MKTLGALFVFFAAACPQTAPAPPVPPAAFSGSDDTVIATLEDGKRLTYGEFRTIIGAMPPQMQQMAQRDRKSFVSQYALMRKLAQMAEAKKLAEKSPTREMLEYNRMQTLASAQLNEVMNDLTVAPEDVQAYYNANRGRFTQVQVKAIYISFVSSAGAAAGGKKYLTEPEARLKIDGLLKEIRGGADFVKLVHLHSEDQTSAGKDGDFGNIRRSDNLPDAVRNAIFALKEGEVSEVVRQPNGFYLFRADKLTPQPFEQVRDEIFNQLKDEAFRKWMDETQRGVNVKFDNDAFFSQPAPKPAAAPAKK